MLQNAHLLSVNTVCLQKLHSPSMFAVKAKIYGVLYNKSSSFDETSSYWSVPKSSKFRSFSLVITQHLVSIGQHFVTTRVVHLLKRTKTSLINESDQSRPLITSYCSYARPAQPGLNRTRLCGPCIAAIAGFHAKCNTSDKIHQNPQKLETDSSK